MRMRPADPRTVGRRLFGAMLLAGTWSSYSCSSAPAIADPIAALATAEKSLEAADPAGAAQAYDLLTAHGEAAYQGEDLARYRLRLGQALYGIDDPWSAYKSIRDFADEHGFSAYRPGIEDLSFEIGNRLIRGSTGFSFYGSERSRGLIVLEHFITRYPRNRRVPDALRLLGEAEFIAENWLLSRERFTQIVTDYPDSEWVPLAKFKIAMARFNTLVGPSYDQQAMVAARNELRDFLALRIDNPQFRQEADTALQTVQGWLGEKQLEIAHFYRTIGNPVGHRNHLEHAIRDYPKTDAGRRAQDELQRVFGAEATAPEQPEPERTQPDPNGDGS